MPFYELMYETGRSSVACYADDLEAQSAIAEQHRRALAGEAGGPIGAPAERVAKVRVFDKHPNELNPDQTMGADVLTKEVASLIKALADENGVVAIDQLVLQVRGLSHPMVIGKENSFDSNFIMKPKSEMSMSFLEEGE